MLHLVNQLIQNQKYEQALIEIEKLIKANNNFDLYKQKKNEILRYIRTDNFVGRYEFYPESSSRKVEGGLRLRGIFKNSTDNLPLVSVITVVYNNPNTLDRCIESVLAQTYSNIEYIIIDGGSDIPTLDIINKHKDSIDYFISEKDNGIYNAMNKGIELAKGDYICLLNSDDFYEREFVEKSINFALKEQVDIVYTDYKSGQTDLVAQKIDDGIFLGHLNICHNTFLVSKKTYNDIGRYNETLRIISDAVWIRKAYREEKKFGVLNETLFSLTEGGLSSGNTPERRQLFIGEVVHSYINEFPFLSSEDAEKIYLFRFNKNRVGEILDIAKRYSGEELFIKSLSLYVAYCFRSRNNFVLSHTEYDTTFPKFLELSEILSISPQNIQINTKHGMLSDVLTRYSTYIKTNSTKSIKVLHYIGVFSRASETFVYDLLHNMQNSALYDNILIHDHQLLAEARPCDFAIHIPWNDFKLPIAKVIYHHLINLYNPDLIVCHFAINEKVFYERISDKYPNIPTISMTHGIDVFSMKKDVGYSNYLLNQFSKRNNVTFSAVSNYLKQSLEDGGVDAEKIQVIPNSVNDRFFKNRKKDDFFDFQRTLRILAVGRLIYWKGHELLLDAVKNFSDSVYKDVKLTIVYGNGDELLSDLRQKALKLNISDKVDFVKFVDFNENPSYFTNFDLFVHPSRYNNTIEQNSETFGVAVLEAITAGLPVITTDAGGLPEVVGDENIYRKIVKHSSSESIFEALKEMFEDGRCFSDNHNYALDRLNKFSANQQLINITSLIFRLLNRKINTSLFSTGTIQGAGYAAYRLHKGLNQTKLVKSKLFTTKRDHEKEFAINVVPHPCGHGNGWKILHDTPLRREGLTIFSLNMPVINNKQLLGYVKDADIINIHWVARFLSVENIAYLSNLGKPLVITVRDMHPITGGCHYFHKCNNWQQACVNCPQEPEGFPNFAQEIMRYKHLNYNFKNITLVCLSEHTKNILINTPIFNQCNICVIPNSIETDTFSPHSKDLVRKELGLPSDKKIIGYIPSFSSEVKGYTEVQKALHTLKHKYTDPNIHILLVGNKTPIMDELPFEKTFLGYVRDNDKLAKAYSACDVVVVPSLEETFSNTTAEAIACGVPVVGFKTGAIPDLIIDGLTGITCELGDVDQLARALYDVLNSKVNFRENCRSLAEDKLGFMRQAFDYEALFFDILLKQDARLTQSQIGIDNLELSNNATIILNKLLRKLS